MYRQNSIVNKNKGLNMNRSKFVKFAMVLVAMTLMVPMLFAAGMKETASGAVTGRIVSVDTSKATPMITVRTTEGEMVSYMTDSKTVSSFPVSALSIGDYIETVASGDLAQNIRYINPLVALQIKDINISSSMMEVPQTLKDRFSYTYGYLLLQSFANQNLFFNGGYYIKGVMDGLTSAEQKVPGFYTIEELYANIDAYQTTIWNEGKGATDYGKSYASLDEIKNLPLSEDLTDAFSYTYGYLLTYNMIQQGIELNSDFYIAGSLDFAFANSTLLTDEEMQGAFTEYQQKMETEYAAWAETAKVENLAKAEKYLEENKTNDGVITTESGLQYQIQVPGDGPKPVATDTVEVNYQLQMADGTVIESSYDSGATAHFGVNQVIPGFQEALLTMNTGSVIRCWIHPSMGYGENGTQSIEPNALLVFDIELVGIDAAGAAVSN
jgi:FKBP-type peptidyl-prolyl cis-trans isomerase